MPLTSQWCAVEAVWCVCRQRWGIQLQQQHIIDLDSSCEAKFSRHLVIKAPGAAFPNNLAMGAFVSELLSSPQVTHVTGICFVWAICAALCRAQCPRCHVRSGVGQQCQPSGDQGP